MTCLCKDGCELPDTPSHLYFITRIGELNRKLMKFFESNAITTMRSHGTIKLELTSPKAFFSSYINEFDSLFNAMEKESIRLYIHEQEEPFELEGMVFSRPLQHYINVIHDSAFFEIVQEQSLTSHFQPIVDARSKTIYVHEALIRGVYPDGSLMYPAELFDKSSRNDMNFMLDRLARESALKTAAVKKLKTKIFINFIPTAIYDPYFCLESTVKWANQLEFDPSQIVFEVVETEQAADKQHLLKILTYYREQGFEIALDDVGEGYSSLNMLINIQPDYIKVDREIIDCIDQSSIKQSVYKALVSTAKDNGIKLLAEGIERKEELEFLESAGVDLMQGYYFGKPAAEPLRKLVY